MAKGKAGLPPEIAELGIEEVRVLRPEPGDIIVLRAPKRLTEYEADQIQDRAAAFFAGHQVVVLENSMSLEVLRKGGEPE